MNFYPVYRLRRSNGSFSRVGSLMDTCNQWSARTAPHILKQAVDLFRQEPGDLILIGPRCGSIGEDVFPDERDGMTTVTGHGVDKTRGRNVQAGTFAECGRTDRRGVAVPSGVRA